MLGDANYENVKSLNDLNVKNSIFEYKSEENEAMRFFNLDYIEQEKSRYSKELFSNYFEWRIQECSGEEKFEHGIAGGYVLFDDILNNNFNLKVQNRKKNKTAMNIESNRIKTDLFYQNICYRIMEHNIWTIDPNLVYKSSFKLTKLKEVFKENFKKITKAEPLLYLLSLVDTIEFIKRMSTTSLDDPNSQSRPTTLSKKILIEIEENHIYIDTNLTSNTSGYKAWYDGITSLNEWTDVLIKDDNGIITIK